jgi:PAS domain S-box-containing protein
LQHLDAMVVALDTAGAITLWNRGAEELTGWTAEESIGRMAAAVGLAPSDAELIAALSARMHAGIPWTGRVRLIRKDKMSVLLSVTASPALSAEGELLGTVLLARESWRSDRGEERARANLDVLVRAGRRLGRSLNVEATLREIADLLVPTVADHCVIDLTDEEGHLRRVTVVHAPGGRFEGDGWSAVGAHIDYPHSHPCSQALRRRHAVLLEEIPPSTSQHSPTTKPTSFADGAAGLLSLIAAPLVIGGKSAGVISVASSTSGRHFGFEDRALLEEIAGRAAVALDHARTYQRERGTALALQESMLPGEPPELDGVQVTWRYSPARSDAQVGGDWVDLIPLPLGRSALVIGDVQGRGVHAAALMGQLRTAVRSYAALDLPPGVLMAHLDNITCSLGDEHIATCLYSVYDPFTREYEAANAGHLFPLLAHAGSAGALPVTAGPPLGVGKHTYPETATRLPAGSLLALFTDGLVESRSGELEAGLRALLGVLASRADAGDVADQLMEESSGGAHDDRALLLAKTSAVDLPIAELALPARLDIVAEARAFTRSVLGTWHADARVDIAELVVSELVTNAVRHPRTPDGSDTFERAAPGGRRRADVGAPTPRSGAEGPGAHLALNLALRGGRRSLWIEVHDADPRLPFIRRTDVYASSGRGLQLVEEMTARWGARTTPNGKSVWAELRR